MSDQSTACLDPLPGRLRNYTADTELNNDYAVAMHEAAERIEALEAANAAFGKRQEWWTERMFVLELKVERDAALLKQALAALEYHVEPYPDEAKLIEALRERLGG